MMTISVIVTGIRQQQAIIRKMIDRLEDMSPVFKSFVDRIYEKARYRLEEGGDPPWAAAARDYGHPLLRDTGALYNSMNADNAKVTAYGAEITTPIPYAGILQTGSAGNRMDKSTLSSKYFRTLRRSASIGLPPRPFLFATTDDKQWLRRELSDYIIKVAAF